MNLYLNADCMNPETGLPSYPDNYFKLAIVDPPYGIEWDGHGGVPTSNWKKHDFKHWDTNRPSEKYFTELYRVSENQIVWGANHIGNFPPSPCWVIWDKMQKFTTAEFEMAWTSFKSPAKAFRMARCEAYVGTDKFHPTQKPIALYRWLLKNYAKAGDNILDTHVGSASSLIAFEEMGFEYVGFELDADYYRDSCKRLEAFRAQPKLFSGGEIFQASKLPEQGSLF